MRHSSEQLGAPAHEAIAPFRSRRRLKVLKKESIVTGLLIAAAGGAVATSVPAFASVPTWGGGGCCASLHSSFFHHARNRNWNGNESDNLNHIRLRLHNRNN